MFGLCVEEVTTTGQAIVDTCATTLGAGAHYVVQIQESCIKPRRLKVMACYFQKLL